MATPNQNKCPRCGVARTGEFKYCPNCGANFEALDRVKQAKFGRETIRRRRWEYAAIVGVVLLTAIIFNIYVSVRNHVQPISAEPQAMPDGGFGETVQRGHELMDSKQFPQAIVQYERALSMDSMHADIMVDLGACYHAVGDNEEAAFQFRRALAQVPNHPVAIFNLGVVSFTIGDTASGRQWWTKFLEVAPDAPQAPMVRERLAAK